MRIAYIAAGAAGMYCGSCLHDNTLAAALLKRGEDVLLVPTYTPLRTDEPDVSLPRVFFGGINVYLQQKLAIFRHTPWWLDRLLDQRWLLNLATRGGPSVDPAKLGDLTVSMLRGEEGHQSKELDKLVTWLIDDVRPDVVHLSNSMFVGLARRIAERCGPPVVCSLSGEDLFLEQLQPPHYQVARELLRERSQQVDAFVALNGYYADFMADYLAVPRECVHVIPHGLELTGYDARSPREKNARLRIGYLARICHAKGLHLLVEACEQIATNGGFDVELHAAGYLGPSDRKYLEDITRRAERGPLAGRFRYVGELDRTGKIAFLKSLDVFSTPTVYRESKGLPALEAMACGVPVVLPAHGSFPEIVGDTGGGVLFAPHDTAGLAAQLAALLGDPERSANLGRAGKQAVFDRYHADKMAGRTLDLYRRLVKSATEK
ncbi:MAG: glycosyltransferase family 4 protein [Pirellulales bacterium]